MVGDPAQTIYQFAGADPSLLTDFPRRYPQATVVELPTTFRCDQAIAAAANALARDIPGALRLQSPQPGGMVRVRSHESDGAEARALADEIVSLGGAGVAADLGAISAEHLMQIKDEDIPKMAESGTVAVLLPATSFFLMSPQFAPARKMLDAGVTVALSTDFNPGSCPCENLQMVMSFAAYEYKLTPLEILQGVTLNAAKAIGREDSIGSFEKGKRANITVFNATSPEHLIYRFGQNLAKDVWIDGKQWVKDQQILPQVH